MEGKDSIVIGENILNGKDVMLKDDERKEHMHIIGTTGSGKSKLLEHMIRSDIKNGKGLCLIDPHGDLYQSILKYVARRRMDNKVIIIDPNDEEWAVGINYLEYDPTIRSSTSHASEVMKGIAKVFGGEDTDVMPRLQRWEKNALTPLIEKKLTVIEMARFVDPDVSYLRELVLREIKDYDILDEWKRFDNAPRRDRESYIEAVFNRANKFTASASIKRIFGQANSTIDFRKAMDEGKIILCNLACTKLSSEEQSMLAVVIIDKITQAGLSRKDIPEGQRRPFYLYLDEFGLYVSEDIAKALWQLRKFQLRLIFAHQELEQLKEENKKVYSAVLAEPQVRVSFRVSRQDAEILAKEMFTGKIKPYEKRKIVQTKFRPVETTRTIRSHSEGVSESESESQTDGETETSSYSDSSGNSISYIGDVFIPIPNSDNRTFTQMDSSSSSRSSSSSSSRTSGTSVAHSESTSESKVPWYEFDEFKEVSSIQDFGIEEIMEKYIAWIKAQPSRRAQVKIKEKPPMPIITPSVKDLPVRTMDVQVFKEKIYHQYALPASDVDQMIEQRRTMFLAEAENLGIVEPKKQIELTPETMRHKK